ncbi:MAG: GNAT family N-acetyltransferase [Candidatus Levybacteria bacterium]|nr:GNAT family N-acetyltransferase [Candidatus Levybacteria bacterium]
MIIISIADLSDADQIFDIFEKARGEMKYLPDIHTSEETHVFVTSLVISGGVLVAKEKGRVAGFIHAKDGWVNHLYIDPAFQNQGVGKVLLEEVKEQNPEGLYLWVFEENLGAIKFYEREGFRLIEKRDIDHVDNEEHLPDRKYSWQKA